MQPSAGKRSAQVRKARRRQGSKPNGRGSAGAAREPRRTKHTIARSSLMSDSSCTKNERDLVT
ncbi:hypothetical protein DF043_07105 [Burkholderia cepacia]|nr:hypothetical protein DF043_07105 [Burkholderia cepacia]